MFKIIKPEDALKPKRRVNRFFIHCSASDVTSRFYFGTDLVKTFNSWHLARGWSGIGYHYVIDKDGVLVTGRPLQKVPAAQAGHNVGTITVCVHGLEIEKFTKAQYTTLKALCKTYDRLYNGQITFWPHNAVSNKACPVFDIYDVVGVDRETNRLI